MFTSILKLINDAIAEKDSLLNYYRNHDKEQQQEIKQLKEKIEQLEKEKSNVRS